ncbi:hypothetical protein [Flavobacterium wongokense]|uniref:hypothetical protein n=1 Tax=Flavobacterium wongokense TaxID=2910674 RepID=UPI001F3A65D6|nr:hypothetical protein [Flavobacterium sp. WG47]MCF6132879.1 hypothetical protein [Flavobacterium sp. WG47]
MKTIFTLLANLASLAFGYVFVSNLKQSADFGYLIYMSLLVILFFIFIILGVLSFPKKGKSRRLFYNSYSDRRTKDDKFYSFMHE